MDIFLQLCTWQEELDQLGYRLAASPAAGRHANGSGRLTVYYQALDNLCQSALCNPSCVRRSSERRIDSLRMGYVETDSTGIITRTNTAAGVLFNFPRHYVSGQPLLLFIVRAEQEHFFRILLQLQERKRQNPSKYIALIAPIALSPFAASVQAIPAYGEDSSLRSMQWVITPLSASSRTLEFGPAARPDP